MGGAVATSRLSGIRRSNGSMPMPAPSRVISTSFTYTRTSCPASAGSVLRTSKRTVSRGRRVRTVPLLPMNCVRGMDPGWGSPSSSRVSATSALISSVESFGEAPASIRRLGLSMSSTRQFTAASMTSSGPRHSGGAFQRVAASYSSNWREGCSDMRQPSAMGRRDRERFASESRGVKMGAL